MICDYYGGPNDGGSCVISDELCEIGSIHEWCQPIEGEPMHADFADPSEPVATCHAFYRLTGIFQHRCDRKGIQIAHLEYLKE